MGAFAYFMVSSSLKLARTLLLQVWVAGGGWRHLVVGTPDANERSGWLWTPMTRLRSTEEARGLQIPLGLHSVALAVRFGWQPVRWRAYLELIGTV